MKLEQTILTNLVHNEEYLRKVIPFIKPEYFSDRTEKTLFDEVTNFVNSYNTTPNFETLIIALRERKNLTSDELSRCEEYVK